MHRWAGYKFAQLGWVQVFTGGLGASLHRWAGYKFAKVVGWVQVCNGGLICFALSSCHTPPSKLICQQLCALLLLHSVYLGATVLGHHSYSCSRPQGRLGKEKCRERIIPCSVLLQSSSDNDLSQRRGEPPDYHMGCRSGGRRAIVLPTHLKAAFHPSFE